MLINQIYNIDNMDGYEKLYYSDLKVKAIVTDPPFLLNNKGGVNSKIKGLQKIKKGLKEIENSFDFEEHLKNWKILCKPLNVFMFLSNSQISEFMRIAELNNYITTLLVWHKPNSVPFTNNVWRTDLEYILHIRERKATFNGDAKMKQKVKMHYAFKSEFGHPTEKPIKLISELIEICSNENDLILDPFIGSGTTAVASLLTKRNFIGFEINKTYHEMGINRINSM